MHIDRFLNLLETDTVFEHRLVVPWFAIDRFFYTDYCCRRRNISLCFLLPKYGVRWFGAVMSTEDCLASISY